MNQFCFNIEIWLKMKVEPMFIEVFSTLTKQRWKNYVDSMLMTQCCFNFDIWLKQKAETALKQLYQYFLHWCSLQSGSITKPKQKLKVDSTFICVEITSRRRSTWYPRWFNVDLSTLINRGSSTLKQRWFWLTLKKKFVLISWCLKN